jgi:hypothetical protein
MLLVCGLSIPEHNRTVDNWLDATRSLWYDSFVASHTHCVDSFSWENNWDLATCLVNTDRDWHRVTLCQCRQDMCPDPG